MVESQRLVAHVQKCGLELHEPAPGWRHMGALLADAALQPGLPYKTGVLPKVKALQAAWPDADTTNGLLRRIASDNLGEVLRFGGRKLTTLISLAALLSEEEIQSVHDLQAVLQHSERGPQLRLRLQEVKGVGPKTVDYIGILAGVRERAAVDVHVRRFAAEAGVSDLRYEALAAAIGKAAAALECSPAALDAAIWKHMSER